jgi:small subunit ribosomal protein S9
MERINTIGRRKNSIARIYMTPGEGKITLNGREFEDYFPTEILRLIVEQPFEVTEKLGQFDIVANCNGGGIKGQAEAVRLGIARALVEFDEELKPALRGAGLVTRDPRMVERKKYGRRKARRRFQFSKR